MKQLIGLGVVFLCGVLLRFPALGISYVDDFTDSANNNIKSYSNLAYFHLDTNSSGMPDRSAFSFASSAYPVGTATYRVQNAGQVTVGFYTAEGSFVNRSPEGLWILGKYGDDPGRFPNSRVQASFSESKGGIYALIDGKMHKAHTDELQVPLLHPEEKGYQGDKQSPTDLKGYGVNVYASATGQSWSRVSLVYTTLHYTTKTRFCYEEMTGSVPAGTRYVRVELNDVGGLYSTVGENVFYSKGAKNHNLIASVTLAGEDLIMGVPEPVLPEPVDPEPPLESESDELAALREEVERLKKEASRAASSKSSGSKSTAGSAGTAAKTTASASKASSASSAAERYEGPKFEGVIEASKAGEKAPEQTASGAAEDAPPPPPPEEESAYYHAADDTIYEITAKNGDDNYFTAGITIYIIGVIGVLAWIVLKSTAKKN